MTTPAMPSCWQAVIMIVPISAELRSPLPSITSTSPGLAIAMAAWIIRLSPGRTSTVRAVPASFMRGLQRLDAAVEGAAAAGHVGQDGRLQFGGPRHDSGGDAFEVANDVGQSWRT